MLHMKSIVISITACITLQHGHSSAFAPIETIAVGSSSPVLIGRWMAYTASGNGIVIAYSHNQSLNSIELYNINRCNIVAKTSYKGNRSSVPTFTPDGNYVAYADGKHLRFLATKPDVPTRGNDIICPASDIPGFVGATLAFDKKASPVIWANESNSKHTVQWWRHDEQGAPSVEFISGIAVEAELLLRPIHKRFVAAVENGLDAEREWYLHSWFWADKDRAVKTVIRHRLAATALELGPDGKTLAVGYDDGCVGTFDLVAGKSLGYFPPYGQFRAKAIAFHPSGKYLAYGTYDRKGHQNLFILDLVRDEIAGRLVASPNGVSAVCFNPAGDRLASFGCEGTIKIWDFDALLKAGK